MMRGYYEKWVRNALKIQKLDEACVKLKRTEHKRRLRIWFQKFRTQAKSVKRGNNITDRCDNLIRFRNDNRRKTAI